MLLQHKKLHNAVSGQRAPQSAPRLVSDPHTKLSRPSHVQNQKGGMQTSEGGGMQLIH